MNNLTAFQSLGTVLDELDSTFIGAWLVKRIVAGNQKDRNPAAGNFSSPGNIAPPLSLDEVSEDSVLISIQGIEDGYNYFSSKLGYGISSQAHF